MSDKMYPLTNDQALALIETVSIAERHDGIDETAREAEQVLTDILYGEGGMSR